MPLQNSCQALYALVFSTYCAHTVHNFVVRLVMTKRDNSFNNERREKSQCAGPGGGCTGVPVQSLPTDPPPRAV